jgi:hypothetical protein
LPDLGVELLAGLYFGEEVKNIGESLVVGVVAGLFFFQLAFDFL